MLARRVILSGLLIQCLLYEYLNLYEFAHAAQVIIAQENLEMCLSAFVLELCYLVSELKFEFPNMNRIHYFVE